MALIANIDDTASQRYATTVVLRRAGHTVIEGENGNDALVLAKRRDVQAMIIDVDLPDIDGFGVLKRLREAESTREMPVILISAVFTDPHSVREGFRGGATAYLTLPIDPPKVISVIRSLLGSKHDSKLG